MVKDFVPYFWYSDLDQLTEIMKIMGTPTQDFVQKLQSQDVSILLQQFVFHVFILPKPFSVLKLAEIIRVDYWNYLWYLPYNAFHTLNNYWTLRGNRKWSKQWKICIFKYFKVCSVEHINSWTDALPPLLEMHWKYELFRGPSHSVGVSDFCFPIPVWMSF